jgi:hypothetical protein
MTLIPFASGTNANIAGTNSSGETTRVVLVGHGNSSSRTTSSPTQFDLTATNNWYCFSMPQGMIDSIYGDVSTVAAWTPSSNVTPYLAIATAAAGSNRFTIVQSTITPVSQTYAQGTAYPIYTTRVVSATGLDLRVAAGTRIMVVGGIQTSGGTQAQALPFSYTGGVVIQLA